MKTENEPIRSTSSSIHTLIGRWKDGTFSEILDDWKWIFRYGSGHKAAIVLYTLIGIIGTSFGLAASVASKYLIDIITGFQKDKLWLALGWMLGSAVISIGLANLRSRMLAKLSIAINNDIQADVFDRVLDAGWMELNRFPNGDLVNRFNSDVSTVSANAVSWLPSIVVSVYSFIATFLIIWHYSRIMSLIAFGSAPVMLFCSRYLIRKQRQFAQKVKELNSDMMSFEVEAMYNLDTIKSFGIMPFYSRRLREWQKNYKNTNLQYNMFAIRTNILLSVLGLLVQYSAFGYGLYLLWSSRITYGTMTLFLEQRARLSASFNEVVGVIPSFLNSSVSAHRIRELMQLEREPHASDSGLTSADTGQGFSVCMEKVDFSYADEEEQVIGASSFYAQPGEIVAIVGPSGEGKTTMIRLILGLVQPDRGKVFLQTADGSELETNADSRCLFSYVPQGNTILQGTIAENLRIVKEEAADEELIDALQAACAWEFVSRFPDTLQHPVGEKGKGLSEGQAQRIAIARAILRDAPIMLLDEATSALDVQTERQVLRSIIQHDPNRTCIVTTHRPTVLNMCSRVYRVMDTRVTELTEEESSRMAMDF
ncbi:MAG: ABC transporter ATP-binding protein [Eubacteriales bacterium]|nr:ABC transporter ATP-binding protein [Eubacteriales bacterium]